MKKILLIITVLWSASATAQLKDVLVPYRVSNHWGFSDSNGKIVIQPIYDSVSLYQKAYSNGKFVNYAKVFLDKKVGLINEASKPLLALQYAEITNADYNDSDRFIVTDLTGKSGLVDLSKVILPVSYDKIRSIRNNSYLVEKTGKLGIVDYSGKVTIPIVYNQINFVSDNDKVCKWKVVNEKETKYIETPVSEGSDTDVSYSLVGALKDINDSSLDSLKLLYDDVYKHRDYDYAFIVKKGNKFGFVNLHSKASVKPTYANLNFLDKVYHDNTQYNTFTLLVTEGRSKGMIDEKGNLLLPPVYDDIRINGGNCEVKAGDLTGYYFTRTNKFFEPKYKGYTKMETFDGPTYEPVYKIIGVYETEKKDWYYIGENGTVFKQ